MVKIEDMDAEEQRSYKYQSTMFRLHRQSIKYIADAGACKLCGGEGWVPVLKRVPHEIQTPQGVKKWWEWEYRVARCNCKNL